MNSINQQVKVINVENKLSLFTQHWSPKIVGDLNDHKVQVVKVKGKFVWHHHDNEDELFLVISGQLIIHFNGYDVTVNPGEMVIIPHPLEHMTEAKVETHIVLIEPKQTLNTGNVIDSALAAKDQDTI